MILSLKLFESNAPQTESNDEKPAIAGCGYLYVWSIRRKMINCAERKAGDKLEYLYKPVKKRYNKKATR